MSPLDVGSFPLTSVDKLPNAVVAFPGEHWSDGKASEIIVPGEGVVSLSSGGKKYIRRALAGDVGSKKLAIALRTVQIPDVNTGPNALGPNEIVNQAIQVGEYVHEYRSGAFQLTLIEPDATYAPGDLIGWDPVGARPTGKGGNGSWKKAADEASALFEVHLWRPYSADGSEGVLTVRSLRGQF